MIARVWKGRTRPEDADTYVDYVARTGLHDLRATPGNLGAWLLRARDGATVEFTVISLWESPASIAAFAGDDIDVARYYPEDPRYLLEMSKTVDHYEAFSQESLAG